jgi:hypothetical protein
MEREVYKMRPSCPSHEIDPRNRYRFGKYQAVVIRVDLQIDLFANMEIKESTGLFKKMAMRRKVGGARRGWRFLGQGGQSQFSS